jgi:hypothetical protein
MLLTKASNVTSLLFTKILQLDSCVFLKPNNQNDNNPIKLKYLRNE